MKTGISEEKPDWPFLLMTTLTFCILLYFCFFLQSRGDESFPYLYSFRQAYSKFPGIDLSPYWPVSSFYLWLIGGLEHLTRPFLPFEFLTVGRLFSLLCWLTILILGALFNQNRYPWKIAVVLFNPYLLVYATRAHPLIPALLLFLLFWFGVKSNRKIAYLLLPFAVNFQVFIGGAIGLFIPSRWPLKRNTFFEMAGFGLLALTGVILTWLTWGGVYPKHFIESDFYRTDHLNGKPSWGYPLSVVLLSGLPLWIIGSRGLKEFSQNKLYSISVISSVLISCLLLFAGPEVLGITELAGKFLFGDSSKVLWISTYGFLGLGWLRLDRNQASLLFGLLGSSVVLIGLPYFYERISFFATFAPCLVYAATQENNPPKNPFLLFSAILIFVIFAIIYELFGAL